MKQSQMGSEELTLEVQGLSLLACPLLASAESAKVFSSLWHHLHANFAHIGQVLLPRHSGDSAAHSQMARIVGMASHNLICPVPHLAKETHSDASSWLPVNLNVEEDLQTSTSEDNCSELRLARLAIHAWARGHCSFYDHLDSFFRTLLVISGLLLFFLPSTAFRLNMLMHNAARHARRSPLRPAEAILKIA